MYQFLIVVHVFIAVILIGLVLLNQPQGGGMGSAMGAGASQTVFGSQGSTSFIFKITATFGALFFVSSLLLTYFVSQNVKSAKTDLGFTVPKASIAKPVVPARAAAAGTAAGSEKASEQVPAKVEKKKERNPQ